MGNWRNWKLQNQVLSIFLAQSLAISLILLTIVILSFPNIEQLFKENSKTLMIRQNNQSTTFTQYLILKNISVILNRGLRQIVNANYLFQHSIALDYQYIQQPLDCLDNPVSQDSYSFNSSVCYGHMGLQQQSTIQDQQFFNYTALTTLLIQMYDDFTIFYTQTRINDSFFTQFPGRDLRGFNPHERPWYKKYMEKTDTSLTTICPPFLANINQYRIVQSTGLKYQNGSNFGVFGNPLTLLNLLRTAYENIYVSIVDKNGMIYSVGSQNDTQIYICNQSYTGFDQEQQTQILDSINQRPITLYNANLQQNVTINSRSLPRAGLILVFQSNPLFEEDKINLHLNEIANYIIFLFEYAIFIWIGTTIFCMLLSVILLLKILKPISHITHIMKKAIYPKDSKHTLKMLKHNQNTSSLSSFQNSFNKMIAGISQSNLSINNQCTLMNNAQCYELINKTEHLCFPLITYLISIENEFPIAYQPTESQMESFYQSLGRETLTIQ